MLTHNPELSGDIDQILLLPDRKSRLSKQVGNQTVKSNISNDDLKLSYFLQRILDRNRLLDKYSLRLQARGKHSQKVEIAKENLTKDLGRHIDSFLFMCQAYYREVALAQQGLWEDNASCLLERANINPPHKQKILYQLVGNLLGEKLDNSSLQRFMEELWNTRSAGKSTVKSACEVVEKSRKAYGNYFNERLNRLHYRVNNQNEDPNNFKPGEKEIWQAWKNSIG